MRVSPPSRKRWWGWWALALVLGSGCATSRTVRLEVTDGRSFTVTPRDLADAEVDSVEIPEEAWRAELRKQARTARPFVHPLSEARALFGVPSLSGLYGFDKRHARLIGLDSKTRALHLNDPDEALARDYLKWCELGRRGPGDCLGILEHGGILGSEAKFTLALTLGMGSVWEGTEAELGSMTQGRAMLATIGGTLVVYFMLLTLPEPISKGLAAIMTVAAISYLGVDVFFGLLDGWVELMDSADAALTFSELREAGDRFGKRMGQKAARLFVMLATAAMGGSASQLATKIPTMPGAARATLVGMAQAGVDLGAVAQVQSVAITSGRVTIMLAPNAVAMASRDASGSGKGYRSFEAFKNAHGRAGEGKAWHHIVEQRELNLMRFGPERIHNEDNLVLLEKSLHDSISGYYSSIRSFTKGLTVRQWLGMQSYEAQRAYGLKILRDFGGLP